MNNTLQKPKYRYRFYMVYGFVYPSEVIPRQMLALLPSCKLSEYPCVGDIVMIAGVKHTIINKHGDGLAFWYVSIGQNRIHIFREPVENAILRQKSYVSFQMPVTDITNVKSIEQLPLPFYSARIVAINNQVLDMETAIHNLWYLPNNFATELARCWENLDRCEDTLQPIQMPYDTTGMGAKSEAEKEEEAIKTYCQQQKKQGD